MLSIREKQLLDAISGERARRDVAALVALGERVSGSSQEHQGAALVREALSPFVDTCELEGVPVTGYLRHGGRLTVLSPSRLEVPCEVGPISGSATGEARLIDGGNGASADYARRPAAGKAVLVTNDAARRGGVLTHLALEAQYQRAACLIFHQPGMKEEVIPVWPVDVDFPVLSISNRSAAELRRLLSGDKEVRVSFEARLERYEGTTYNVVGTRWGSQSPGQVIYLTGHYDSWFSGANDNASAVACLLEVARALHGYRPRHTLRFIAWGSEESGAAIGDWGIYGLMGAYGYGQAHRRELEGGELALTMLNGEMLGFTPRTHIQCTPELMPLVKQTAGELGEHLKVSGPAFNWTLSDHLCYHALGLPLIYLLPARDLGSNRRSPYWNVYHTAQDNLNTISERALAANTRLLCLLTLRLDRVRRPYSLQSLTAAAVKGGESLPNREGLGRALRLARLSCRRVKGEEGLRRELKLIGLLNRSIYALDRPFGLKFPLIAERIARLKEAGHILELEGDLGRARAVLLSLADCNADSNYSPEVTATIRQRRAANPVLAALGLLEGDWSEVLACLNQPQPVERIVASLRAKIDDAQEMGRLWAQQLEQALGAI